MSNTHPNPALLLAHVREGAALRPSASRHVAACPHCARTLDLLAMGALGAQATDAHHRAHADAVSEEDLGAWIAGALSPQRAREVEAAVSSCRICASLAEGLRADLALLAEAEAFTSIAPPEEEMDSSPPALGRDDGAAPSPSEQAEGALSPAALRILGQAWRRGDDLKVDDPRKAKVLEIREHWGDLLLDVRTFTPQSRAVRLGEGAGSDLFVPKERLPHDGFPLLRRDEGGWILRFTGAFRGFVERGEAQRALGDLIASGGASPTGEPGVYEWPLTEDDRFVVAVGADLLSGAFIPQPRALPTAFSVDLPLAGALMTLFALFTLAVVLVQRLPPPPEARMEELPPTVVQLLRRPPEAPAPAPEIPPPPAPKAPEPEGERAKEAEGKVGKRDVKTERARGGQAALDRLEADRKAAESAGLLGADLDEMAHLFGAGGLDAQVTAAASGLSSRPLAAVGGSDGRGPRGGGPGGGGTSEGIAGVGTRGGGPGGGGYGDEAGYTGVKKDSGLDLGDGKAFVLGQALDPSLIDKAIRAQAEQIRYCYSRELNRNPRLYGKVVTRFVIGADGRVVSTSIKESTVGSGAVGNCVSDRLSRIQFPHPKGGVNVTVIYPFNFNAAG